MKNEKIKAFLVEVAQNENFRKEFAVIQEKLQSEDFSKKDNRKLVEQILLPWSKKLGYNFSKNDLVNFDKTQTSKIAWVSHEELANVSGGSFFGALTAALLALVSLGKASGVDNIGNSGTGVVVPQGQAYSNATVPMAPVDNVYGFGNKGGAFDSTDYSGAFAGAINSSVADPGVIDMEWFNPTPDAKDDGTTASSSSSYWDRIKQVGSSAYETASDAALRAYNAGATAAGNFKNVASDAKGYVGAKLVDAYNAVGEFGSGLYETASDAALRAYNAGATAAGNFKNVASDAKGYVGAKLVDAYNAVGKFGSDFYETASDAKGYVGAKLVDAYNAVGKFGSDFYETASDAANAVKSGVSRGASNLYQKGAHATGAAKEVSLDAFHGLEAKLQSLEQSVVQLIHDAGDSAAAQKVASLIDSAHKLLTAATDFAKGSAVGQEAARLFNSAQTLLTAATDFAKGSAAGQNVAQLRNSAQKLLTEAREFAKDSAAGQKAAELLNLAQQLLDEATNSSFAQEIKENPRASAAIAAAAAAIAAAIAVINNSTQPQDANPSAMVNQNAVESKDQGTGQTGAEQDGSDWMIKGYTSAGNPIHRRP